MAVNSGARIVFPEGNDDRVRRAAQIISDKNFARVQVIETRDDALSRAARMVAEGKADGMVAGACYSTADVFKKSVKLIGVEKKAGLLSSFFLMESASSGAGRGTSFLFSDCAIIPSPDEKQLASIACITAENAKSLLGWQPRVAFLSFSTKGSSLQPPAEKVSRAVKELEKRDPGFLFDGELQLDAAIVPEVARKKDPEGRLKGRANILIFPDLNSANIGYKIAERLGGMKAVGPILQGFKKPVNDLSRGCSVDDIVSVSCFTSLQVVHNKKGKKKL